MNQSSNGKQESIQSKISSRWYKEPWAWFIVAIIITSVCWGIFLLSVSIRHADEVVIDDYYKVGKAINQDLRRDQQAADLQLQAIITLPSNNLEFSQTPTQMQQLQVEMSGMLGEWPQQLRLHVIPIARDQSQQTIALVQSLHNKQLYTGTIGVISDGEYYLQLETLDPLVPEQGYLKGWRINNKSMIKQQQPTILSTTATIYSAE